MGREGAYTTVLKLMQIMTDKGLVKRDDSSRTHVYKAASSEDQTQTAAGHRSARQGLRRIGGQARAAGARRRKGVVRGTGRDSQAARRASWRKPMNPWIDVAGWTLVHFLWQGAAIAAARRWPLLWLLRHRSPQARYAVACAALVAMLAAPTRHRASCCHVRSSVVALGRSCYRITDQARPGADTVPDARAIAGDERSPWLAACRASHVRLPDPRAWLPLVVMLWVAGVACCSCGCSAAGGASVVSIARRGRRAVAVDGRVRPESPRRSVCRAACTSSTRRSWTRRPSSAG